MIGESPVVAASEDNKEVKAEAWGHIIKERSMTMGGTESHPIREQIGLVGLCCRHDATSGRFHCSEQFRAKNISGVRWHMHQEGFS